MQLCEERLLGSSALGRGEEVRQKSRVNRRKRLGDLARCRIEPVGSEETVAGRLYSPLAVSAMRADPENSVANSCRAFQVCFVILAEKAGEVYLIDRGPCVLG